MTFRLNTTFAGNENYIRNPILLSFCRLNKIGTFYNRADMVNALNEYANTSNEKQDIVQESIEKWVFQGAKHLLIRTIDTESFDLSSLNNFNFIEEKISAIIDDFTQTPINNAQPELNERTLANIKMYNNSLVFTFLYRFLEPEGNNTQTVVFPVHVVIDFRRNIIYGRGNNKTKLFRNRPDRELTKPEKPHELIKQTINYIIDIFHIQIRSNPESCAFFKDRINAINQKYTETPNAIETKIASATDVLTTFIDELITSYHIKLSFRSKAIEDLKILFEKYLSLSVSDPSVFTENKQAYPFRLRMKTDDYTKVDEQVHKSIPLQLTEAFYDNKKTSNSEKTCDRLNLCYKRLDSTVINNDFTAIISTEGSYCLIVFSGYVEEGDIQNVLSDIM